MMVNYVSKEGKTDLMVSICHTQPDVPNQHDAGYPST